MNAEDDLKDLVRRIRDRFPSEASLVDQWMRSRGYNEDDLVEMTYVWLESFAARTTEAACVRNAEMIQDHTDFVAQQYRCGSQAVRDAIDVAYAENLMFNAQKEDKVWAWPHVSAEIRQLYEAMWGEQRF